ncbi:hypothetical protein YC2023_121689 [Brassica napus]
MDKVLRMSSEKGVVIFSKSSCCLSYAVQVLFQDLGVSPKIHEIDKDPECREIEKALMRLGCSKPVPAVFIGGKLVGSTNEVMSMHLSSSLINFSPHTEFARGISKNATKLSQNDKASSNQAMGRNDQSNSQPIK